MAMELLASLDEADDGEWGTCWDFSRNDWGISSKAPSSWSSWSQGQGNSWWSQGNASWGGKGTPEIVNSQEGPWAGDMIAQQSAFAGASSWGRGRGYGQMNQSAKVWGPLPAPKGPSDAPFWGDSAATAAPLSGLTQTMQMPLQAFPLDNVQAPPPPPPWREPPNTANAEDAPPGYQDHEPDGDKVSGSHGKEKKKERQKDRESRKGGEGKGGKGGDGSSKEIKDEITQAIEALLALPETRLQKADFDQGVRRFLGALRGIEGGQQKMKDAMAMIQTYTVNKNRDSVKNWPAYLLTLLKRFDPGAYAKSHGKGSKEGSEAKIRLTQQAQLAARYAPSLSKSGEAHRKEKASEPPKEGGPSEPLGPAVNVSDVLPADWAAGRKPVLEEVSQALANQTLHCPFTGKELDLQDALLAPMADAMAAGTSGATPSADSTFWRHVQGVAGCQDLEASTRTVQVASLANEVEFRALSHDVSLLEGFKAISRGAKKNPSGAAAAVQETVAQESALEVLLHVLKNPCLARL
eukprot:TRINITY_DN59711_c0_g1_i1.p1 TRINITY_DN59711_c0_g1~~TRINITY_DN59711_c0_g1_i1.p1  ORF type:complete len:522 (-),score=106.60 TRINITY_DN59711_c0_g1_i1:13-1578(-)